LLRPIFSTSDYNYVWFYYIQAFCEEGNITENGILSFAKFVIFPILELQGGKGENCRLQQKLSGAFKISRPPPGVPQGSPLITSFIISMTKLLDADWLRGVQLFH
jgi:hypothetical protein